MLAQYLMVVSVKRRTNIFIYGIIFYDYIENTIIFALK